MAEQSTRIERLVSQGFLKQTRPKKFSFFQLKLVVSAWISKFRIQSSSSTPIGTLKWTSRLRIVRTESVKDMKSAFTDLLPLQKSKKAFYRKLHIRKAWIIKLFRRVCSMTTPAMLIGKRSLKNSSGRAIKRTIRNPTWKSLKFLPTNKSIRWWQGPQRSSFTSTRWTKKCICEKAKKLEWNSSGRRDQGSKTTVASTTGWSKNGKCRTGSEWSRSQKKKRTISSWTSVRGSEKLWWTLTIWPSNSSSRPWKTVMICKRLSKETT